MEKILIKSQSALRHVTTSAEEKLKNVACFLNYDFYKKE